MYYYVLVTNVQLLEMPVLGKTMLISDDIKFFYNFLHVLVLSA